VQSTKRAATRQANMERIKAVARVQLENSGAAGLSLREVAREMNQTSSALYRYFSSRDELLTALILDAYNDLGAATERAESRIDRRDFVGRWRAATRAIRKWAKAHPHEYALIFGSPVPGYQAPELTVAAATRVTTVIGKILTDYFGENPHVADERFVSEQALLWPNVSEFLPGVPRPVALRAILVWARIFGFISFELFGHFVGSVKSADALYAVMVDDAARELRFA